MSEGLPVAIMESVSHAVPAIGVKDYGTSEIVIDGYTGKLLQPDFSIADLTEALRFMKDSSDVIRYRANARKHFQDYFNAAQNYMDFAQELAELAV
jgi:glycosyltransferase involved in cell wall biosynthesis